MLLKLLAGNGFHGHQLVRHVMDGVNHHRVVALNRGVIVGRLAGQIGTQTAAIKERQAQRRAHAPLQAASVEQAIQPNAGKARKRHQVDVGIELRFGAANVLPGGFNAPARGHDVGTPAQKVGWHACHVCYLFNSYQWRVYEGYSPIWLSCQSGQRVPGQLLLFQQRLDLLARLWQGSFALFKLQPAVEPGVDPVAHQVQGLFALGQHPACHHELVIQTQHLEIAARHMGAQQNTRCLDIGFGGFDRAQCTVQRGAVFAEKVQLPTRAELQRAAVTLRSGQRGRHCAILGEKLVCQVYRAVELRQQRGICHSACGARAGQAGLHQLQAGVATAGLTRLRDQAIELLIAKLAPPLGDNSVAVLTGGSRTRGCIAWSGITLG